MGSSNPQEDSSGRIEHKQKKSQKCKIVNLYADGFATDTEEVSDRGWQY